MALGAILGTFIQITAVKGSDTTALEWISIIGEGYVRLLQLIVIPLVLMSILSAVLKLQQENRQIGRMSLLVIGILVGTAIIAAGVGILSANGFGLSLDGLQNGVAESARTNFLESRSQELTNHTFSERLVALIPTNIFQDLSAMRSSSTIGVVIFAALLGISASALKKRRPESFASFQKLVTTLHDVVMELVKLVLRLTPYGVGALMVKIAANSSVGDILKLGEFILVSYIALAAMFLIHLLLLRLAGINPVHYLRQVYPVLIFAFSSRSSAGTIPLNTQTQIEKLGVDEGMAGLSASLGATIGQNGCAAIYPAMLAVMIAPTAGIDPTSLSFIAELIAIVAISSFGVAGVGGGATFAALMVLTSMNLPVGLAGLLISVDPLLDMGRTTLNVNGSMITGVIGSKIMGTLSTGELSEKVSPEKI